MDILFMFEDGSEALAHYGTKGMKWGHWNEETKARYASKGIGLSGGGGGIISDTAAAVNMVVDEVNDQSSPLLYYKNQEDYDNGTVSVNAYKLAGIYNLADALAKNVKANAERRAKRTVKTGRSLVDSVISRVKRKAAQAEGPSKPGITEQLTAAAQAHNQAKEEVRKIVDSLFGRR